MIKSPLRYPGGKSRAVELIASIVPQYKEFREPFLGGASVFLYLKQKYPNRKYWINDLYFELYIFWQEMQLNSHKVILQIYEFSKMFETGKELHSYLLENMESFNNIQKAASFFIFNRITFSGTTLSGGYSEQAFKGRFTETSIKRLLNLDKLLFNTQITNLDYEDVVNSKGDNVFIFLDPPYFSATKSALYGKNGNMHKGFDHQRFADTMKNCNHKWLITYDDSPYIRDLFSFANIMSWDLTYGMRNVNENSNQIGKELFISNYIDKLPSDNQLPLFCNQNEELILK